MTALWLIVLCGALSIVYAIWATSSVLKSDAGSPRILVDGGSGTRPNNMKSSITIMPYMMDPGEDRIVADAIYEGLTKPGHYEDPVILTGAPAQVKGKWSVSIQYSRGVGEQQVRLMPLCLESGSIF